MSIRNFLKSVPRCFKNAEGRILWIPALAGVILGVLSGFIFFNDRPSQASSKAVLRPLSASLESHGKDASSAQPRSAKKIKKPSRIRIAIILDDIGHNRQDIEQAIGLGVPLTVSVLPFQPFSHESAKMAYDAGLGVMVHLPMEPHNNAMDPGEGAILTSMRSAQIEAWTQASFDDIPFAAGVNNHMGSLATENSRVMKSVLKIVKKRNLFFVDSCTSTKSCAFKTAGTMGVTTAKNEIFLDNDSRVDAVLEKLERISQNDENGDGLVIAIGHPHQSTFTALREFLSAHKEYEYTLMSRIWSE